jgi:hypothetical protein
LLQQGALGGIVDGGAAVGHHEEQGLDHPLQLDHPRQSAGSAGVQGSGRRDTTPPRKAPENARAV